MKPRILTRVAGLGAAAIVGLLAFGCSKQGGVHLLVPNQRPVAEITSAPANSTDTSFYAYRINWTGYDPDGRVDHFTYAVDPTDTDTLWHTTNKKEDIFFFRATVPVLGGKPGVATRSVDPHTFVIKAWDNLGLASEPRFRSFTSYTVSPTVFITSPPPIGALQQQLTPATTINWVGVDPDGQFTQKPIKYKYKLLARGNTEFSYDIARSKPDSLRRFYAKTNFANWDSVGGDTTVVQYTGLLPSQQYIFIVIGYDEAGAYSPLFSLTGNMLQFQVGFAGTLGPRITVFNESFFYTQPYGSWYPDNPITWVPLEIPAGRVVTFNWFATPPSGLISYYRWRIGGDVLDETPRTPEATDWSHWSAKSSQTTLCTIGPFAANVQQLLYIAAWDNNGLRSCVTIQLKPVQPDFAKSVLIVDDTRAEVDQFYALGNPKAGQTYPYTSIWPAAAELDTFLYARGGVFWRGTQVAATAPIQPVSPPGLFAGYDFDTLGTRQGYQIASAGVPLSFLGHYKHVIWLDDHNSGLNSGSPIDLRTPTSTLHWMCTPNHQNTLGSYMSAGGSVWLSGGTGAFASLREFDAKGVKDNNNTYNSPGKTVFSLAANELIPGRLMYDGAHWQNEMVYQQVGITVTTIQKSPFTPRQPWSMPGFEFKGTVTSPDYTHLPATLRIKLLARGDTLPPTRALTDQAKFYSIPQFDAEYLTQDNRVMESIDPNPDTPNEVSVLDTLMSLRGSSLVPSGALDFGTMTYYHGVLHPDFIFCGFPIWLWTRSDCMALVDFVMQDIWKLPRANIPRAPQASVNPFARGVPGTRPATTPTSVGSRMPASRSAKR